ncbi:MAG: endonuclease [Treponema sp.]|jgi:endonuclease/exonuclease/phosphatase family metal-dependent hydrolase|nr:endonuclease [Treponema sp.]
MAGKTTKSRRRGKKKPASKPSIIIAVIVVIIGALYYLWRQNVIQSPNSISDVLTQVTGEEPFVQAAPSDTTSESLPIREDASFPSPPALDTLHVYSFNIQIFGDSKMKKTEVVKVLVDIVSHADVMAIQEVRAISDEPVKAFMSKLDPKYDYVLGPREGRTASKEQYWVIYDTDKLEVKDRATFDDAEDWFQRSPMAVYFQTKDKFDFILINNHIQPSDAAREISVLPEVIAYFQDKWGERDVMVMGDFNADGSYYNENNLIDVFPESDYLIILTNEYDTTVAGTEDVNTTYDRFIITDPAREDYTGNFGVIYYDKMYDFAALGIEPKQVSDHFPLWAEFWTTHDTD